MTSIAIAQAALAKLAAYPKSPTRREEIEYELFCREALKSLAEAVVRETGSR